MRCKYIIIAKQQSIILFMLNFLRNGTGKILKLFFQDPEKEYYLREIGKHLGQEPGFFQKCLENLVNEGILLDEYRANLRYFRLNKEYPLYEEIKKMVSKTLGIEVRLKELADLLDNVECAFVFGSVAKNAENGMSDIDLMLIGKVDQDKLIKKINELEDELGREINYHIYYKGEIVQKLNQKNDFIVKVFEEPKILLKGNPNEYTKTT